MRLDIIDILRGTSLIGMMVFHANYLAMNVFHLQFRFLSEKFSPILGFLVSMSFIVLSGFIHAHTWKGRSFSEIISRSLKRALLLSILAIGITLTTYLFFYEERINWGIIHFFALASLLHPFFARVGFWLIPIIGLFLIGGEYLPPWKVDTWIFIPLGIFPSDYYSADYYPLIPWFGYLLLGQALFLIFSRYGLIQYLKVLKFPKLGWLCFLGRHSLLVYIIHVPILYLLFSLFIFML